MSTELLEQTPKDALEALQLLQDINSVYTMVDKKAREQAKPHYDAIKKIHKSNAVLTKGLWEKQKEVRALLIHFTEKR